MAKPLTDSLTTSLRAKKGQSGWREIADGGCRGLYMRISPRGEKTWAVRHMVGGTRTRHTMGGYPSVSLAEARKRAALYLAGARDNVSADEVDAHTRSASMTVAVAHAEYILSVRPSLKATTMRLKEQMFRDHIKPVLGKRLVRSIRRADIIDVVTATRNKYPVQANRVFSEIMALLRWSEQRDFIDGVPSVRKKEIGSKEQPRRRTLTHPEIAQLWQVTSDLGPLSCDFIQVLLLTGQRRDEVRNMTWAEVDLDHQLWTIPKTRYKTGIAHVVPLSEPVVAILRKRGGPGVTGYVLPGRTKARPFNGAAAAMRQLRKKLAGKENFTLHDLRRTLRTGLSRLGVADETAEMVIGHVPQGLRKVYDMHDRLAERRKALSLWAQDVLSVGVPKPVGMDPVQDSVAVERAVA
jgi:integrase